MNKMFGWRHSNRGKTTLKRKYVADFRVEEINNDQLAKFPEMMGKAVANGTNNQTEVTKQKHKLESELWKQVMKHNKTLLNKDLKVQSANIAAQMD